MKQTALFLYEILGINYKKLIISLTLQCNGLVFYHTWKTAKITKDGITSQHSDISAMCCDVIPSFVIFAVFYVW